MQTARIWLGLVALVAGGLLAAAEKPKAAPEKPKITAIERSQGWRLIFDGESLSDWRSYGRNKVSANWTVAAAV